MRVSELVKELNLKVVAGQNGLENEISGGYVSDLLSDVMGNSKAGQIWITLQTHKNVAAIASLKELSAIILVSNFKAAPDTIDHCNEENIPVLCTELSAFEIAGLVYNAITVD